jgi:anti-anti-sigma regulatory factor
MEKSDFNAREFPGAIIIDVPKQVLKGASDQEFKALLGDMFKTKKSIGINFSNTEFITSSTIATLIAGLDMAKQLSVNISIINPLGTVRDLLTTVNIMDIFTVYNSESDFLEVLGAAG